MLAIDPIEAEIDKIRDDIYEKTKNMSNAELLDYFHKIAEKAAKKYGFNLVESLNTSMIKEISE
ncbi:MAG: hypothetical protein LBS60_03870 [Deltaproteobacteria bacterium]|nr:hypothetical protein [Deltaproteobacteria bacterium]